MNKISLRCITIGSPAAQDILAATLPELKPCPFYGNPTALKLATPQVALYGEEIQW